jgi:beta-lactamase class D
MFCAICGACAHGENSKLLKVDFGACRAEGSVTLYDEPTGIWYFTDKEDAQTGSLPASTFKIPHSLIALQEKTVLDEHEIVKWDGIIRRLPDDTALPEWNRDTDMVYAFKHSVVWYYEHLAERIGNAKYADYLRRLNYGNGDFSHGKGVNFWVAGNFKVSPEEQIHLLRGLYHNDLPFSPAVMETVKEMMVIEEKNGTVMRGKTGWTVQQNENIGWWVGYVEQGDRTVFFATRLRQPQPAQKDFAACRKTVTQNALHAIGVN